MANFIRVHGKMPINLEFVRFIFKHQKEKSFTIAFNMEGHTANWGFDTETERDEVYAKIEKDYTTWINTYD